VTELEHNTVFVPERDVIVTNDAWRIYMNMDLTSYEDVIVQLRGDVRTMYQYQARFIPVKELKPLENLLDELEGELTSFREMLPKGETKRGLMNVIGTTFQVLFGTATVADLSRLHNEINEMRENEALIAHSMKSQMTYVKSLGNSVLSNTESVAKIADRVKAVILKFQSWSDETDYALHWVNSTIYNQTNVFTYMRELEYAIIQIQIQVREIRNGLSCTLLGKLSTNLVPPKTLHMILRNVSTHLPDGYTMFAGTKWNNIHLYYEYSTVTVLANTHGMGVIVSVPLKTYDRHFTMFRIITLPYKVQGLGQYVQLETDFPFLLVDEAKQHFLRLREAEVNRCTGTTLLICPVDTAILSITSLTCESSLYFQKNESRALCRRKVMSSNYTPVWKRISHDWIYSVAREQKASIRCLENSTWFTSSVTLKGNGVLHDAISCHVVGRDFELLPEIQGSSYTSIQNRRSFELQHIDPLTDSEVHMLQLFTNDEISQLDYISTQAHSHQRDINTLLEARAGKIMLQRHNTVCWYWIISLIPTFLLIILCCYGKPCLISWITRKLSAFNSHKKTDTPQSTPEALVPTNTTPIPVQRTQPSQQTTAYISYATPTS
jgi:hypothetical protein